MDLQELFTEDCLKQEENISDCNKCKKYYRLSPEVAGGLGEGSRLLYENKRLKEVVFLEYQFTGWLGDELLACHPCFIASESLRDDIEAAGLRGVRFEAMAVTFWEEWEEMPGHPVDVPPFARLRCDRFFEDDAQAHEMDFYVSRPYRGLIVSERALRVLRGHRMAHCDVAPFPGSDQPQRNG